MKSALGKLKLVIMFLLGFIPKALPVGVKEFEKWSANIIKTYGLPDNDSMKFALAAKIMHMDAGSHRASPYYFCKVMKKAMSNQVCSHIMTELKIKQQEAEAKEKEAQLAQSSAAAPKTMAQPEVVGVPV